MRFERILFGTAGVPNSTEKKSSPVDGVVKVNELGLDWTSLLPGAAPAGAAGPPPARTAVAGAPAGLCSVPFMPGLASSAFATGLGSALWGTRTRLGAFIMARMASASASAFWRRSIRSLARKASSSAFAFESAACSRSRASWASR
jgi:hypothetical protein